MNGRYLSFGSAGLDALRALRIDGKLRSLLVGFRKSFRKLRQAVKIYRKLKYFLLFVSKVSPPTYQRVNWG
jgi:hypothetical protein